MDTLRTLKALLARLARAPIAPSTERRVAAGPSCWSQRRSHRSRGPYDAAVSTIDPRTAKQRDGDEAEAAARRYLEQAGLVFVASNVRYRDGEIDLVMRDAAEGSRHGLSLVFVEVRRRRSASHGGAAASVTPTKRRRVVAAASHYLVGLGMRSSPPCRFDVVTVDGDAGHGFGIAWIRDAFRDEDPPGW